MATRITPTIALVVTLSNGCLAPRPVVSPPHAQDRSVEKLQAVLWLQRSGEYRGLARSIYATAAAMLDRALLDSDWTAAPEQHGSYQTLPPAVIVDVDETVLDNSAYEARLLRTGGRFAPETWTAWCLEGRATGVPGAAAFTRYAALRGATVFYVTNREADVEEATRENLRREGFALAYDQDVILARGERPEWSGSEKSGRRQAIAATHRIVLLIGDNLGDFLPDAQQTPEERAALVDHYAANWGSRWHLLPNPIYGSWERAILGHRRDLGDEVERRTRSEALETRTGE